MAVKPEGIDISNHNNVTSWAALKGAGIAFAVIKATEGTSYVDPKFAKHWKAAKAAGLIRGAYHFFRWDFDPAVQAAHFIATVGPLGVGDMPLIVDIEAPTDGAGARNYGTAESVRRVRIFVDALRAATGKQPIIYTYPYAWQTYMGNSKAFAADCDLWIASYKATPSLTGGWDTHKLHQYTASGIVPGVGKVDRDTFNGSLTDLRIFAGLTQPPPEPPPISPDPDILEFPGITPFSLQLGFKALWQKHGVVVCGYPISPEYALTVDGIPLTVQDCENVQFEWAGPGHEPRIGAANRRYQQLLKAQPGLAEKGGER